MRKPLVSFVITLVVLAALLLGLRSLMPRLASSVAQGPVERAGERRLADCPDKPNCQGSDASEAERQVEPFALKGSGTETMAALVALIESRPDAAIAARDEHYLHATFTSSLMGFVDDVEFLVDEPAGLVRVRSASRLGHSDLGANARRIETLREAWADA